MTRPARRHVLMVAYHFPPVKVSSGLQRTLKFATYLRDHGWSVSVLSADRRAYAETSDEQLAEIPPDVEVRRALGLDTQRHLSLQGRYLSWMALPDRWVSWSAAAVVAGMGLIRRRRPAVIWSTYPIATAHLIGLALQRLSGLPWVADFRDSMTEPEYPTDPAVWRCYRRIERATAGRCSRAVFTTPAAREMYLERYPAQLESRCAVIPNGYDEDNFTRAESRVSGQERPPDSRRTLVHSGVLYPSERDPTAFFDALAMLRIRTADLSQRLRVVLRATGHDSLYREAIESHQLSDVVELAPAVPYEEALSEMLTADGLLLFQARNCNHQIPAKLYEYFRAQRPVLALTDPAGDTARTLSEAGIDTVVPLDDAQAIARALGEFLEGLNRGTLPIASSTVAARYSRRSLTEDLSKLLDDAVSDPRR